MATGTQSTIAPYDVAAANDMYDLLFADRRESFRVRPGKRAAPWQQLLSAEPPDVDGLRRLAADPAADGRVRCLAHARLRDAGQPVPRAVVLGVVVEVGLIGGLDTLAAYSDGGVRYVNHSGKMLVVEAVAAIRPLVDRLLQAAAPLVARLRPSDQPRQPPPERPAMRLTFLASDGLRVAEGPGHLLEKDALAGPVFRAATELLVKVIHQGERTEE